MSAFIVSSGRSSISQWPVFGNVIELAWAANNFTCFPNASPLALLASDRENGHCSSRMTRYPYELHNLTRARRPLKAAILRYPIAIVRNPHDAVGRLPDTRQKSIDSRREGRLKCDVGR
jgi:hypothetical protein